MAVIFFGFTTGGFFGGLVSVIMAAIFGVIELCFLRFFCELYLVLFRMGDDISAIRGGGKIAPPSASPASAAPTV